MGATKPPPNNLVDRVRQSSPTDRIVGQEGIDLTYKLAPFFAKRLDDIKSLYYSEESFDDFYYGKGSTYPDVNGGIGILFEQASSRGHIQDTINGPLSFAFTIKNQLLTSLSTFKAAVDNRQALLDYQADFYNIKIPQNLAVVGMGNSQTAQLSKTKMTTIDINAYEIGKKAISQIFQFDNNTVTNIDYKFIKGDSA